MFVDKQAFLIRIIFIYIFVNKNDFSVIENLKLFTGVLVI